MFHGRAPNDDLEQASQPFSRDGHARKRGKAEISAKDQLGEHSDHFLALLSAEDLEEVGICGAAKEPRERIVRVVLSLGGPAHRSWFLPQGAPSTVARRNLFIASTHSTRTPGRSAQEAPT